MGFPDEFIIPDMGCLENRQSPYRQVERQPLAHAAPAACVGATRGRSVCCVWPACLDASTPRALGVVVVGCALGRQRTRTRTRTRTQCVGDPARGMARRLPDHTAFQCAAGRSATRCARPLSSPSAPTCCAFSKGGTTGPRPDTRAARVARAERRTARRVSVCTRPRAGWKPRCNLGAVESKVVVVIRAQVALFEPLPEGVY